MKSMFQDCKELELLDLGNLITFNVKDMQFMFSRCYNLKEIKGINNFNTINVTNMSSMSRECKKLEYLDLSNFDTSNVSICN